MSYSSSVVNSRFGSFIKLREEAGFPIDKRGTGRKVYHKEIILKMLVKDYIENNGPLSMKQLSQNKKYPSLCTLRRLFTTTKISEIWEEVAKEAIKVRGERTYDRNQNQQIIDAGIRGEKNIAHNLGFLDSNRFIVYNDIDIYSKDYKLSQQIDHLIIGPGGIISIETKSLEGEIVIRDNGTWEQYKKGVFNTIPNPTQQVMRHENILKCILLQDTPIKSIIAMGNYRTNVKNEELCAYPIVNANMILPFIQKHSENKVLTEKEIRSIDRIIKKYMIQNPQKTMRVS